MTLKIILLSAIAFATIVNAQTTYLLFQYKRWPEAERETLITISFALFGIWVAFIL